MRGLIQKSSYIKSGHSGAGNYMSYIATRDGVEPVSDDTAHQESGQYMKYIAERPRSHGLFSSAPKVSLTETMDEVSNHPGPVWTFVYSLRREDAARLVYDSAASWRRLIAAHQTELAEAMKIPPNQFRWCAAFHDEKHHPHIHMMAWSADPQQGYLTETGIEAMRSKLSNDIFQDELLSLYQQKDFSYQEVVAAARDAMRELLHKMDSAICDDPVIARKMEGLAEALKDAKGKKVYGYLKKPVKAQVDEIVDALARLPEVAESYEVWNRLEDDVDGYYTDKPREWQPLSQQKEFKSIKNMVIREAENFRLGVMTFEDERMEDEMEEEAEAVNFQEETAWQMVWEYRNIKAVLCDDDSLEAEKGEAVHALEQLWGRGFTVAAHQLGKCWRDGLGVLPDDEQAELWFRRSSEAGNAFSQYALAKLYLANEDAQRGMYWLESAAHNGSHYAAYRLGKEYLQGRFTKKDVDKAVECFTWAAKQENQYAQYMLGKLYLIGQGVPNDKEQAVYWLTQAANQGNQYAQFFLDRQDSAHSPAVILTVTRLLHHMSSIFRQNSVPPANPAGGGVDRKLRQEIQELKIAMGHRPDDHEEQQYGGWNMTMG